MIAFVLGLLLSMGPHAFAIDLVYLCVPGAATFRRSIRYRFLLGLALPLLVAIGFDAFCSRVASHLTKRYLWGLVFVGSLFLAVLWGLVLIGDLYPLNFHALRSILHVTSVTLLGWAFLYTLSKEPNSAWWFGFFLCVFVFDLYAHHPMYDTSPHARFVNWRSPVLRTQPRGPMAAYRTMNDIEDGSRNASNLYLLRDAMNYDHPLLSRRYYELLPVIRRNPDILRFFNIKRYLACLPGNDHYRWCLGKHQRFSHHWVNEGRQGFLQLYRLKDPIPRILWVPHVVQVERKDAILPAMEKLDPWRIAVVERDDMPDTKGLSMLPWPPLVFHFGGRGPTAFAPKKRASQTRGVPALITSASFNVLEAKVEAPHESLVVINEVYYKGWRATLDGKPVPIVRANFMMMGVRVPKGRHTLRVTYHPRSFKVGLTLSLLAVLFLFLAVFLDRRIPLRVPPQVRAP
ncbi:MAG: YfhO family protein [Myxococcales bacterium]|nr:YfhO family protein [Myxococcales bacterium]